MTRIGRSLLGAGTAFAFAAVMLAMTPSTARAEACPDPSQADDIRCQFHNGGQSLTCCYWSGSSFLGCCTLNAT